MVRQLLRITAVTAVAVTCLHATAAAQQAAASRITGVVVAGGTPLGGATVRLLELHLDEDTHENGSFDFEHVPPGHYTLVVQRIGYRPDTRNIEVTAGTSPELRVELTPAVFQLAPVVVTGTVSGRPSDEVLSPTSVVTGAELDRRVQQTIAATLQNQPGVSVASLGPTTGRPVIRGLSGDRIVILEDGARPGDLSAMSSDHAVAIEPVTAKQFEVVRGPMSLLYGSSALGGVVNVIREEIPTSLPTHLQGSTSLEASSVNTGGSFGGYAVTHKGRTALRAEASARKSGNMRTPVGTLGNTGAGTYGGALSAALIGEHAHTGASYRFYLNDYGVPGGFQGAHPNGVDIHMRRHSVRLETERHSGSAEAPAVFRATSQFTGYAHEELSGGTVGTRFGQAIAAADAVYRQDNVGPLAQLALGTRGQFRDIVTGGSLHTPSTWDVSGAGFFVGELGRGALRAQTGIRYEAAHYVPEPGTIVAGGDVISVHSRTFGSFSGSFGLLYAIMPGLRVGTSVARSYRTPDFDELYSAGPHLADYSYNVGDPDLKQEVGFGLDGFLRLTTARVRGEVAVYRNNLADYVFPSSRGRAELGAQGGVPRFQYTNEDAVFTGAEGEFEWSITNALVVEGTASYVNGRFTSARAPIPVITLTDTTFVPASQYPPFIPPFNGRAGLRYEHPSFFVGGEVRFSSRQDRLGDGELPTAGYAVGNVTGGVRLLRKGRLHTFTLRVDNVANTEYRDHLSRVKVIMPEPGLNVSLLYRFAF
jgi:iron complex outermembrane receptor protein